MSITFQPAVVITGTDVVDAEAPQIAVSGQNVYVLFHEPPTASSGIIHDVYFAASANRGGSFAPRINLSDSAAVTSEGEDMVLSGGRIYVVWSENFDSIRFRRSTNQGAGFDTALPLSTAAGAQHPQIKADGDEVVRRERAGWVSSWTAGNVMSQHPVTALSWIAGRRGSAQETRPRGSKVTRIRVILPSSTWLQLATGIGSATLVCRSNQVITSAPSTNVCCTTTSVVICARPSMPWSTSSLPDDVGRTGR